MTVAPASCARVSSTLGSGCTSRSTLSFRGLKPTRILTDPNFFGTTAMPAHHGVGSSTREITPSDSMHVSSSCTFFLRGKGTFCGVKRAQGLALGLSLISKLLRMWVMSTNVYISVNPAVSAHSLTFPWRRM